MNTGVQRSGATPPAARTATTQAVGDGPGQRLRPGQERAADRDGARDPLRGHRHRRRPARPRGQGRARDGDPRRALPAHPRAPARWAGAAPRSDTIKIARLAKETGLFPVFEAERGEVTGVSQDPPAGAGRGVPARSQRRYAHLFEPDRRDDVIARIQARADRNIARFGLLRARRAEPSLMDKPFAITLDVGSSLANKTGSLAHRAPGVRRPAAALQPRLPGRREHPGLALPRRGAATTRRAWRALMQDNPFPAVMGRVCYHPCETACNRGQLDEAVGIHSVERFLGDEAIRQGWSVDGRRAARGKRVLVVGAGPSGLSAAYHLAPLGPRGHDPRGGPAGRRHDALRHPHATACRATCSTPRSQRILDHGRDARAEHARSTSILDDDARGRLRRRVPGRRRAHRQARLHPRRRGGAHPRRRVGCCAAWRARSGRCSAAASWSTAAATRRWTSPARPSAWAPPRRSSSTAARASGCPRTTSRSRRRSRRA